MARMDWATMASMANMARKNIGQNLNRYAHYDTDDWLAEAGLRRRRPGAEFAGAVGFVLLGCAIGIGFGMLMAPKSGNELRRDINQRFNRGERREQFQGTASSPTYSS